VLLGGYQLVRQRSGDLLHRRVGRLWMLDMYWVSFSSFGIKEMNPGHFSWILGLSAWTILSLTVAIWAAATHRVQAHRQWVVGTYLGLIGAGIAAVAFPQRLVPQTAVHHPLVLIAALAGVTAMAWFVIRLAASRQRVNLAEPVEPAPAWLDGLDSDGDSIRGESSHKRGRPARAGSLKLSAADRQEAAAHPDGRDPAGWDPEPAGSGAAAVASVGPDARAAVARVAAAARSR
jgi:uncharacterized membrane protein